MIFPVDGLITANPTLPLLFIAGPTPLDPFGSLLGHLLAGKYRQDLCFDRLPTSYDDFVCLFIT